MVNYLRRSGARTRNVNTPPFKAILPSQQSGLGPDPKHDTTLATTRIPFPERVGLVVKRSAGC